MGVYKRLTALFLAMGLALLCALPATAGSDGDVSSTLPLTVEARRAATWLQEQVPEPEPGDEWVMLALLRSGVATGGDAYVEGYIEKLLAKVEQGPGDQRLPASARQMLVLAAAGVDVNTAAPLLCERFGDMEALQAASLDARRLTLRVFGAAGVTAPAGCEPAELARQLAASRNLDGGYGSDGVSEPIATAQVLQALAFYRHESTVEQASADAREWLRLRQSDFGGLDVDGAPSARATAECAIALGCLSESELHAGTPTPATAMAVFQNEDGGFMADPGKKSNLELTCLGLLAITSYLRLESNLPPVYRMSDVPPLGAVADDSQANAPAAITLPGLGGLSNGALIAILVGAVALIILVAALVGAARDARRKRRRRERLYQLRAEGRLPHGIDPDDEDFELAFDYEYVGDALPDDDGPPPGEGPPKSE